MRAARNRHSHVVSMAVEFVNLAFKELSIEGILVSLATFFQ
jgi:hypothetical protein